MESTASPPAQSLYVSGYFQPLQITVLKTFIPLLFLYFGNSCFCQDKTLDRFYIVDSNIFKNKVAKQIDTIGDYYITEFDTLGREVALYRKGDSDIYRIRYFLQGDTVVRYHYTQKGKISAEPFEIEKYVYNPKYQIVFYFDYKQNLDKNEILIYKFQYDNFNRLHKFSTLFSLHYPFSFRSDVPFVDSLLKPGISYHYFYDDFGKMYYRKRAFANGNFYQIDTFYLNHKGRLVKMVSFQKEGFVGEIGASNIYDIEEYYYQKNKTQTKEYGHATLRTLDNRLDKYSVNYETSYLPTGLVQKVTIFEGDNIYLRSSFIYQYHRPISKEIPNR